MRSAVVNGCRWKSAATELAELVQTVGPRIALVGAVFLMVVAVPLLMRYWVFLPRVGV